jgi:purine-cytosine permease-like protein
VTSVGDFWEAAETRIWTGVPVPGQSKYGFWHILIFAWLCNSSMHLGLADMTIYRYARRPSYGLASAFGMYIGHFMAWIASGILCAVALEAGNDSPSPGEIAYLGAGLAGAICVVVAGWTTANPTLYRSGLAVQGIFPRMKRWKITLGVGAFATLLACSPAIVSKLDQFLGLYALLATPVGAVVLVDIFLFPRLGLRQNLAELRRLRFNWSVLACWVVSVAICYALYVWFEADFYFFMALPGFFLGGLTYVLFAYLQQRNLPQSDIV